MTKHDAIQEAEVQIYMYESMILYNKDFEPQNDNSNYEHKIDFLKTAIDALEKQIPKKPISKYKHRYGKTVCPACETENDCRDVMGWENFCPDCGQSIDWSEPL